MSANEINSIYIKYVNKKGIIMNIKKDTKGSWVTFRPDISILDCTVRDGGLINEHVFNDTFVKAVYNTCVASGVDYMEIGYKSDNKIFSPAKYGKWKFCTEDDMRRIVGENKTDLKIAIMADAERTDYHNDILKRESSVIDYVRVATYIHQIPTALDMVKDAKDKGYETALNLMAVSVVQERELREALDVISKSEADAVYLVDSFGAMYSEQIRDLTLMYLKAVEGTGKQVGIHAHNNQQLAYANTIEALISGASRLDATINGMGRGAGNCPLELLIGFLKNPKFHLRPVLEAVQNVFLPMKKNEGIEWGYEIPYFITGQLNMHPREAIKVLSTDKKEDYVTFFDAMIQEES